MGWKGDLVDIPLGLVARLITPRGRPFPSSPSIFILRNNDIGDLLVTTPLLDALRRRFPESRIVAGVGSWNVETLRGNPNLTDIVEVNAPWNNKYVADHGWPSVIRYIASSDELKRLRGQFDIGIDVVGSHVGSALMMRLGIPHRLGVRGYRGGHTAAQRFVEFNANEHVGRSALRFAELLGATDLPEVRPQIFLSAEELSRGESRWAARTGRKRIALGVGAGFPEKCWPGGHWDVLMTLLNDWDVALIGGSGDRETGVRLSRDRTNVRDFTGALTLRETFAVTAACDSVITNPSMLLHVAAAFRKPTVVVLGDYYTDGAAHDRQWGYPGTCVSLGRDASGKHASPGAALIALDMLRGFG